MHGSPTSLGHELAHESAALASAPELAQVASAASPFGAPVRLEAAMGLPGLPELLLIFGAIVLLFGAKKLPGLGGAIGESIKNFKKGISKPGEDEDATKSVTAGDPAKPLQDQPSDKKPT